MLKKLLLTIALLAAAPASAAIITPLGDDPNSATGHFSNSVFGASFSDQYTFRLIGAPAFVAFASATNDFTQASDFITGFTGQLFSFGLDNLFGTVDDFAVNPPANAVSCPSNPGGCQVLAGSALLDPGLYYLSLTGTGGGTSGYGGNLTVAPVPEASSWAMLLLGFLSLGWLAVRRRRQLA